MRRKSILASTLILTFAGIITRILGFVYRIYMSNVIGAEGIGLYQLIVPVYSLAWSISCSGFTTTISKLTAEERAKKEYGNMGLILKQCVFITAGIGLILSFIFYFFTDFIAVGFLKDERTILSLKILSFCFPFMAAASSIRGYFFGLQESSTPAISQVIEQSVRMIVVFSLASTFIPLGLPYACAIAVLGIAVGEIVSFIYVLYSYKKFKTKNTLTKKPSLSRRRSLYIILSMAVPLTLNRVTTSMLSTFENILIPQKLQLYGSSLTESMAQYGKISGMAMPLIYFPTAFLVSLSISLVPAVSEASAVKSYTSIKNTISKTLLFTSIVGIGSAALFIVFSKELGIFIYNQDISELLFLLGFMCPFIYLQVILSGILNGLGQQVFIFRNNLLSSVINIAFICFFVPLYGINGYILGWFISLVIINLLDLFKIKDIIDLKIDVGKWFVLPAIASLASGLTVNLLSKKVIYTMFGDKLGFLISIGILGVSYMFFVIMSDCISMKDIKSLLRIRL